MYSRSTRKFHVCSLMKRKPYLRYALSILHAFAIFLPFLICYKCVQHPRYCTELLTLFHLIRANIFATPGINQEQESKHLPIINRKENFTRKQFFVIRRNIILPRIKRQSQIFILIFQFCKLRQTFSTFNLSLRIYSFSLFLIQFCKTCRIKGKVAI